MCVEQLAMCVCRTASIHVCVYSLMYRLLKRVDQPSMKFTIYFMGYERAEDIPTDLEEAWKWLLTRRGTIELTQ